MVDVGKVKEDKRDGSIEVINKRKRKIEVADFVSTCIDWPTSVCLLISCWGRSISTTPQGNGFLTSIEGHGPPVGVR